MKKTILILLLLFVLTSCSFQEKKTILSQSGVNSSNPIYITVEGDPSVLLDDVIQSGLQWEIYLEDDASYFSGHGFVDNISEFQDTDYGGTIEAWVSTASSSNLLPVFTTSDTATNNYYFYAKIDNGKINLNIFPDGSDLREVSGNTTINDAIPHQLVWQSNGTEYLLYVDGASENITIDDIPNDGAWFADFTATRENICIGTILRTTYLTYFNGYIYEVRYYNRVLTADEVLQNYNARKDNYQ